MLTRTRTLLAAACLLAAAIWRITDVQADHMEGHASEVKYFPAAEVQAAFAAGRPILEQGSYKIHASRRQAPGMAEVHLADTDIVYVLEGRATIVVGGTVVGGKTTAEGEIRGASIAGGESRRLAPSDVIVVPNGTPHWFQEVTDPFLYYVVKVQ